MYKVLLVDDEPFILDGLTHIIDWPEFGLEIAGYALNGAEAVKVLDTTPIHILITDIKMPKMNGLELVQYIRDRNMPVKCIVLSGYSDFCYVKEAAKLGIENYLLKPVDTDELSQTLNNAVKNIESQIYHEKETQQGLDILRNNIMYRWALGDISRSELTNRAAFLNINFNSHFFVAAVIRSLSYYELHADNSLSADEKNHSTSAIQKICSETTKNTLTNTIFCTHNGDIVLVFNMENTECSYNYIEDILKQCIAKTNKVLGISLFATVGPIVKDIMKFNESFKSALYLQEYCLIFPKNSVITYSKVNHSISKNQNTILSRAKQIRDLVITKNSSSVLALINDIFKDIKKTADLTPSEIRNIVLELVFCITGAMRSAISEYSIPYDETNDVLTKLLEFKDLKDMESWVLQVAQNSIATIENVDSKYSPLLKKVIEYVNQNYMEDINLKFLSMEFNISADYLGKMFKNEVGDTFTNFLNEKRIEKAKELLLNTNLKTNEISQKVGYLNTNYFYTLFKKSTGVSIQEYKGG